MKKINSVEELMELLEGNGYFGLRGLSGIYSDAKYEENEILPCSIDDWEGRGIEYNEELDTLNGTSSIVVCDTMYDDQVLEMLEMAKKYSNNGRVILINGCAEESGSDYCESVIEDARCIGEINF